MTIWSNLYGSATDVAATRTRADAAMSRANAAQAIAEIVRQQIENIEIPASVQDSDLSDPGDLTVLFENATV